MSTALDPDDIMREARAAGLAPAFARRRDSNAELARLGIETRESRGDLELLNVPPRSPRSGTRRFRARAVAAGH